MAIKVGINGFGRMGRLGLRVAWDWADFEIVHVNEIASHSGVAAHLLEFDSIHGRWRKEIDFDEKSVSVDRKRIAFSQITDPEEIPWGDSDVDIVIESSGKYRTKDTLSHHLKSGVKKVVVAAPVKEGVPNIVMGINDQVSRPENDHIVTAASCTTNCLAPIVKIIHEGLGIVHGSMTTIHNVTNTQVMVDTLRGDLRRSRSGLASLIPTTTGSATAITLIYPELEGKLDGHAVRVPLLNASICDCVFEVSETVTANSVNRLFEGAATGTLKGILGIENRPLVSADYVGDSRSAIIDGLSTMVVDGTHIKIYAWYDNEWGYVNRMMELVKKIAAGFH